MAPPKRKKRPGARRRPHPDSKPARAVAWVRLEIYPDGRAQKLVRVPKAIAPGVCEALRNLATEIETQSGNSPIERSEEA